MRGFPSSAHTRSPGRGGKDHSGGKIADALMRNTVDGYPSVCGCVCVYTWDGGDNASLHLPKSFLQASSLCWGDKCAVLFATSYLPWFFSPVVLSGLK